MGLVSRFSSLGGMRHGRRMGGLYSSSASCPFLLLDGTCSLRPMTVIPGGGVDVDAEARGDKAEDDDEKQRLGHWQSLHLSRRTVSILAVLANLRPAATSFSYRFLYQSFFVGISSPTSIRLIPFTLIPLGYRSLTSTSANIP